MAASRASRWHSIYPLLAFNDPRDVFSAQPTFFCGEVLFLSLALLGLLDAAKRPRGLQTFVACFIGGAGVELVTVLHGEVGNFYHSQATIMLFGRREPLYMCEGRESRTLLAIGIRFAYIKHPKWIRLSNTCKSL